jgi:hypothetical protein
MRDNQRYEGVRPVSQQKDPANSYRQDAMRAQQQMQRRSIRTRYARSQGRPNSKKGPATTALAVASRKARSHASRKGGGHDTRFLFRNAGGDVGGAKRPQLLNVATVKTVTVALPPHTWQRRAYARWVPVACGGLVSTYVSCLTSYHLLHCCTSCEYLQYLHVSTRRAFSWVRKTESAPS